MFYKPGNCFLFPAKFVFAIPLAGSILAALKELRLFQNQLSGESFSTDPIKFSMNPVYAWVGFIHIHNLVVGSTLLNIL